MPILNENSSRKEHCYIEKLNKIRQVSELLNANSKFLLKKANIASRENKNSF